MTPSVSLIAGMVSSGLFVSSYVPMLVKAFRTGDLRSYSLANLVLTNLGNGIYWLYIVTLPFGPIWFLHGFYTATMALMLFWFARRTTLWRTTPCSKNPFGALYVLRHARKGQ